MKKTIVFVLLLNTVWGNTQENIEVISSGTYGDAILKIEADTDNNNESDNARIELKQDGGSLGAYIGFNADWGGTTPDNLFRIGTRLSSVDNFNRLVINGQNGNIGIGLSNPTSKLHVYQEGTASRTLLTLEKQESDIQNNSEINFDFVFSDENSNGKPQARISAIANTDTTKGTGMEAEGTADLKFWTANANNISSSNLSERMRITSLGNIGIGTTTPDEKLAVNGNIHTKEVRVDLIGWSDFVFDKNYNLPSLKDVENHIKENGHLKDIPSAEDVEENGILLGDMNAKLLQKIEELTLYTIQQNKQLESQKKYSKDKDLKIQELNKKLSLQETRLKKIEELLKNK